MVEGRMVVMGRVMRRRRRRKKRGGGSEGVYVSSDGSFEVTTGPENMRGVEVGWLGWERAMEGQTKKSERACIGGAYRVL
jgi:hypothetical protein